MFQSLLMKVYSTKLLLETALKNSFLNLENKTLREPAVY